jgi:hypothetical protein
MASRTEPTAAMAATPSARQAGRCETPPGRRAIRGGRCGRRLQRSFRRLAQWRPSTRPSRRRITRSQRAASSGAWVTRTSVAPWRSRRSEQQAMIASPRWRRRDCRSARRPAGYRGAVRPRGPARRAAVRRPTSGWVMLQPPAEPTASKLCLGPVEGVGRTGQFQGRGDVFQRGHGRDQVEGLEDHPHMIARNRASVSSSRSVMSAPAPPPGPMWRVRAHP